MVRVGSNTRRPVLGVPYVAGLSEQLGRVYKAKNIFMYHKPANTLRFKVVHPRTRLPWRTNVEQYITSHVITTRTTRKSGSPSGPYGGISHGSAKPFFVAEGQDPFRPHFFAETSLILWTLWPQNVDVSRFGQQNISNFAQGSGCGRIRSRTLWSLDS